MPARSALVALALAVAVTGCKSAADTPSSEKDPAAFRTDSAGNPSPFDYFPVGSRGRYVLNVHCGLEFVAIDGMTWRTAPRGGANAPAGWDDQVRGTLTRPTFARAVFRARVTSKDIPVAIVFKPAPSITAQCG
jgi:hypothetical protein